jgi:hypothetical protein
MGDFRNVLDPKLNLVAVAICLLTFVLPEFFLRWATRRKRWSLLVLMTLPLIVGSVFGAFRLMLSVSTVPTSYLPNLLFMIVMACWGGLSVLVVRRLWSSARRKRWWTFGVTLAIPLLLMVGDYWQNWSSLGTSERLGWGRWYLIPILAMLNTGFIIVTWILLRAIVVALWRGVRAVVRFRPRRARLAASEPLS